MSNWHFRFIKKENNNKECLTKTIDNHYTKLNIKLIISYKHSTKL